MSHKIAIYLNNSHIPNVPLGNPENGNPGIGGTQFLMFSLPWYMNKYYPDKYEFAFFAEKVDNINTTHKVFQVNNLTRAAQLAKKNGYDVFIFPPAYNRNTLDLIKHLPDIKIKSVAWMHNTPIFLLKYLSKCKDILNCIAVGRVQYEKLRDHKIFEKLIYIPNGIDLNAYRIDTNERKERWVVFMGSLDFSKGFHHLAKLWKKISEKFPEAQLHVIGSGKMYNNNVKTGKLGLTEKKYENKIINLLSNRNGELMKSVIFHGLLGREKNDIIKKACVGVANHPFVSETFCLAAAEMQALRVPVVSSPYGGLLDTVDNERTGYLRKYAFQRRKMIEKLLNDPGLSEKLGQSGRNFIEKKYNYKKVCKDWDYFLESILLENSKNQIKVKREKNDFREFLRSIKSKYKLLEKIFIPTIYIVHTFEYLRLKVDRFINT